MLNQFNKDSHAESRKQSLLRTIERYTGTVALIATWEQSVEPDDAYLRQLRAKSTKLRSQLKMKGLLTGARFFDEKSTDKRGVGIF